MNTYDSAFAYRQSTAFGAIPVGQVVALYDTILRDIHRATHALAAGQIEQRVAAVNHALLVLGELQGVLDFERGGEPARHLDSFYKVVRDLLVQASMNESHEKFQEVVAMVTRIRSAWAQIERSVPSPGAPERLRISSPVPQASVPEKHPAAPESSDTSGHGGWRA